MFILIADEKRLSDRTRQLGYDMGAQMAKFMLSLRDDSFRLLISEAEERGISIQELIRAVIIPDWVKQNTNAVKAVTAGTNGNGNNNPTVRAVTNGSLLQPTITRVRG